MRVCMEDGNEGCLRWDDGTIEYARRDDGNKV
jgi:hypothetical protein